MASSAMERKRRSFPAVERLRSVPGRKDAEDYAGGAAMVDKFSAFFATAIEITELFSLRPGGLSTKRAVVRRFWASIAA
jgi:hypothetical protein